MTNFAQALKSWRTARRFSQLELAGEADISTRHLSFLETGKANPSRDMVLRLSGALDLPLAARNQLFTHAGFSPRYRERKWSSDEMAPIRSAISHTLAAHAPYPAIAVDRVWTILEMNGPAENLFGILQLGAGASLLDAVQDPHVQASIENWPQVAHHTAERLRTESAAQGGVAELENAANALSKTAAPSDLATGPVIPTIYKAGALRLSLFSTIAQFGTPEDLTLDDLKIELFFPTDAATREFLLQAGA